MSGQRDTPLRLAILVLFVVASLGMLAELLLLAHTDGALQLIPVLLLGLGLVAAGISDCPGSDPGGSCPAARAGGLVVSTAVWTGIGIGVDALVADRTSAIAIPPARRGRTRQFPRPPLAVTVRW